MTGNPIAPEQIEAGLALLPPDLRLAFSAALEPRWRAARRRRDLRDAALVRAAMLVPDARPTVKAKTIAIALCRFEKRWRSGAAARDEFEIAMAEALSFGGRAVGWRTIVDALQKSVVATATDAPDFHDKGDLDEPRCEDR